MIWYENEVQRLEKEKTALEYEPRMVFYGSSSIRLWETLYEDFREYAPVNLGFGGSTLAACVWFFERLVAGYRPQSILLYAGDNDLGGSRNEGAVFAPCSLQRAGPALLATVWPGFPVLLAGYREAPCRSRAAAFR